ncbi:MAG: histidinol-phosphatase [Gammaproteobacteria bacterium]|nr:histidinol-phosphatase [Gammaproteobacteria bacterium]
MNSPGTAADYTTFLEELVEQAGHIPLEYFRSDLVVTDKQQQGGAFDPVTRADRETEQFIRDRIAAAYPEHGIIGEEFGTTQGDAALTWLIDPIDGTRGFVSGTPMWGVLVGLKQGDECLAGAMRQPYTEETWIGDGSAAHFIRRRQRSRLRVRNQARLTDAIVCCTHPAMYPTEATRQKFLDVIARCRFSRYGTECLGYGMLASGYVDLVIEGGLSAYDIMPLIPIVEGAGGVITNWQGQAALNGGLIVAASCRQLHEEALEYLAF